MFQFWNVLLLCGLLPATQGQVRRLPTAPIIFIGDASLMTAAVKERLIGSLGKANSVQRSHMAAAGQFSAFGHQVLSANKTLYWSNYVMYHPGLGGIRNTGSPFGPGHDVYGAGMHGGSDGRPLNGPGYNVYGPGIHGSNDGRRPFGPGFNVDEPGMHRGSNGGAPNGPGYNIYGPGLQGGSHHKPLNGPGYNIYGSNIPGDSYGNTLYSRAFHMYGRFNPVGGEVNGAENLNGDTRVSPHIRSSDYLKWGNGRVGGQSRHMLVKEHGGGFTSRLPDAGGGLIIGMSNGVLGGKSGGLLGDGSDHLVNNVLGGSPLELVSSVADKIFAGMSNLVLEGKPDHLIDRILDGDSGGVFTNGVLDGSAASLANGAVDDNFGGLGGFGSDPVDLVNGVLGRGKSVGQLDNGKGCGLFGGHTSGLLGGVHKGGTFRGLLSGEDHGKSDLIGTSGGGKCSGLLCGNRKGNSGGLTYGALGGEGGKGNSLLGGFLKGGLLGGLLGGNTRGNGGGLTDGVLGGDEGGKGNGLLGGLLQGGLLGGLLGGNTRGNGGGFTDGVLGGDEGGKGNGLLGGFLKGGLLGGLLGGNTRGNGGGLTDGALGGGEGGKGNGLLGGLLKGGLLGDLLGGDKGGGLLGGTLGGGERGKGHGVFDGGKGGFFGDGKGDSLLGIVNPGGKGGCIHGSMLGGDKIGKGDSFPAGLIDGGVLGGALGGGRVGRLLGNALGDGKSDNGEGFPGGVIGDGAQGGSKGGGFLGVLLGGGKGYGLLGAQHGGGQSGGLLGDVLSGGKGVGFLGSSVLGSKSGGLLGGLIHGVLGNDSLLKSIVGLEGLAGDFLGDTLGELLSLGGLTSVLGNNGTLGTIKGLGIKIVHLELPIVSVKMLPPVGLKMSLHTKAHITADSLVGDILDCSVHVNLTVKAQLASDRNGSPRLVIRKCNAMLHDLEFKLLHGRLQGFPDSIENLLRTAGPAVMCPLADVLIGLVSAGLSSVNSVTPLGAVGALQYNVSSLRLIGETSFEIYLNTSVTPRIGVRPVPVTHKDMQLPPKKDGSSQLVMHHEFLSSTINLLLSGMDRNIQITKDDGANLSSSLLRSMIPQIASRYPNSEPLVVQIQLSAAPTVSFEDKTPMINISAVIEVLISPFHAPPRSIFAVDTDLVLRVWFMAGEHNLKISASLESVRTVNVSSHVGDFKVKSKEFITEMVRDGVVTRINVLLKDGITLPPLFNLNFAAANITLLEDNVCLTVITPRLGQECHA